MAAWQAKVSIAATKPMTQTLLALFLSVLALVEKIIITVVTAQLCKYMSTTTPSEDLTFKGTEVLNINNK